jgi:hypothetical protein
MAGTGECVKTDRARLAEEEMSTVILRMGYRKFGRLMRHRRS